MKRKSFIAILLLLLLAGCGGGDEKEPTPTSPPKSEATQPVDIAPTKEPADVEPTRDGSVATQEPGETEPTEAASPQATVEVTVDERGVPSDIAIPEDAKDLVVSVNQIRYVWAMDMSSAVVFYEQEMPVLGWQEQTRNIIVDIMGTLNYVKEGGRVSVQLQWNANSKNTRVQISIQK